MISLRQQELLNFILKEFIQTAKPIASDLISKKGKFEISPATIRNDMSDLEDNGYLVQLHTSGGRIPTDKAYRYYVNSLIKNSEFEPKTDEKRKIKEVLYNVGTDPREISKSVAHILSNFSDNLIITRISENDDFFKTGLSSLFELPEFKEIDRIFELTNFFDEFDQLFSQIERRFMTRQSEPVRIFIGHENPFENIKNEAMICSQYSLPGNYSGSMTLIGPTRMDYQKNISLVKFAAEELNKLAKYYG